MQTPHITHSVTAPEKHQHMKVPWIPQSHHFQMIDDIPCRKNPSEDKESEDGPCLPRIKETSLTLLKLTPISKSSNVLQLVTDFWIQDFPYFHAEFNPLQKKKKTKEQG